jgi:predicted permease
VTPNYFRAAGVKLVRGRLLADSDGPRNGAVLIDETLARRYWPAEDPIGREIVLGSMPDYVLFPRGRIVGVVGDVKQLGLGAEPPGMVYVPHELTPYWSGFSIMVRTAADPHAIVPAVRRAIRDFDPSLPLADIRTMDEILVASTAPTRLPMILLASFAAAAIGLALLGVFSVLSYSVARRRRELGIRVALGAQPASVRGLVLRDGLRPAVAGVVAGGIAAFALSGLLEGLLFGVKPADPATFAALAALLLACSALASYLPARRATQVDPITVLKAE